MFFIPCINRVIDHLHSDKTTLRACTLVCIEWLPEARFHLIPSVNLTRRNTRRFLRLLEAPHSTLGPSFRILTIGDHPDMRLYSKLNDALPLLKARLTQVKALGLEGIDWRNLDNECKNSLLQGFSRLVDLRIVDCNFPTLAHLIELLCSFRVLENLAITKTSFGTASSIPSAHRLSSRIVTLGLFPADVKLLTWLKTQPCRALENVFLDDVTKKRIPAAREFLRHLGSVLSQLRVRFADNIYIKNVDNADLDLRYNTKLEMLQITITLVSLDNPGFKVYNLDWIPAFLEKVSSTRLETLNFRLLALNLDQFDLNWEEFDRVLSLPVFANLQRIHFNIAHPSTSPIPVDIDPYDLMEEMELMAHHYLRKASNRGIIHVTCSINPD